MFQQINWNKFNHTGFRRLISRSRKLLEDTIVGNAEAVAKAIEEIRDTQYAPAFYNDEQALKWEKDMAELASMMNIGKEMAKKLDSVGIGSAEELARSGAEQAFLKRSDHIDVRNLF